MHRPNFDAEKREALVDAGQVLHVARQAIERLGHYDFKPADAGFCH
jgi:hypothetical protein